MPTDKKDIQKNKLSKHYAIKSSGLDLQVKDVDLNKRTVQFIANTYNFLDSDLDVLAPGCCAKSIADRGPASNAAAKIKHLSDHKLLTSNMIGRPTLIDERVINDPKVLYFESKIVSGVAGDDHLIKYQEGIYDNHSIGFRYRDLAIAEKDSADEDRRKRWDDNINNIINKELAEEAGFFWLVKEIELFEASVVAFGANSLTGVVGIKSGNKQSILTDLFSRLDLLEGQLKNGKLSDESMKDLELQTLQIKQIITDLVPDQPDKNSTPLAKEPLNKDAETENISDKKRNVYLKLLGK